MFQKLSIPFLCILFFGCVSKDYTPSDSALTIMSYNVENLFDAADDPGKKDETYLPIEKKKSARHRASCASLSRKWWRRQCLELDWSESKINRKLGRLADVILQVKEGRGPDLLILQEVENIKILENLRKNHLQAAGYKKAILIEGPDKRGIDVGMLSRFPLKNRPTLHTVELDYIDRKTGKVNPKKKARPTRGILQADFQLPNGETLSAFGVHFPSQGSPTPARKKAIAKLKEVTAKVPKDHYVIVAGDFNITTVEERRKGLFKDLSQTWFVSHQIGCENCLGTHNYKGSWSFLDVILFSKNFENKKWVINKKSIRTPNKSLYQINHWGGPERFNDGGAPKGVSDHWPIAADIVPGELK